MLRADAALLTLLPVANPPLVADPAIDCRALTLEPAAVPGTVEVRRPTVVFDGARLDLALTGPGGARVTGGVLLRDEEELVAELSCFVGLVKGD